MFCNPVKFAYWFRPFNVKRDLFDTCGKIIDQFWCQIINWLLRNISFTTHEMNAWCFEAKPKLWKKSTVHTCHQKSSCTWFFFPLMMRPSYLLDSSLFCDLFSSLSYLSNLFHNYTPFVVFDRKTLCFCSSTWKLKNEALILLFN